jgi:transposase
MLLEFLTVVFADIKQMRQTIEQLMTIVADQRAELERLRKAPFTPKSERGASRDKPNDPKTPPVRQPRPPKRPVVPRIGPSALDKASLPEEIVEHSIPPEDLRCPHCGKEQFDPLPPDESSEYDIIVEQLKRIIHRRHKAACRCGQHIVTAPAPARVSEGGRYAAGFYAWIVTRRCMDGLPLNRMADMLQRGGSPVSVSTLNDLFHVAADKLAPLHADLERMVKMANVVHADETPQRVVGPGKCTLAYLWVFGTDDVTLMIHSASRSGETPSKVLGDSTGFIVTDAYSGYNPVSTPKRRNRQGCMVHGRREFVIATATDATRARWMLGHIALLYAIEAEVEAMGEKKTEFHARVRDQVSRAVTENMRQWLDEQHALARPSTPIAKAIGYMRRQWTRLTLFLDHVELPLDNNPAERELRRPVVGRKNSFFVRNHEAGERYAVNFSIVLTCRKIGVDPIEYLSWVLPRIDKTLNSQRRTLLPHAYKAMIESERAAADAADSAA